MANEIKVDKAVPVSDGLDSVAQAKTQQAERRVKIILEESPEIPPTGQFFGINGIGYVLRPGEPADVPESLLSVLDDAIQDVPIVNGDQVTGFRKKLRFPYRVLERTIA